MYVGVFLHVRLLMESLAAVLAGVRPRVRVDQQVRRERAGPLKALATLLALHRTKGRVISTVQRFADVFGC